MNFLENKFPEFSVLIQVSMVHGSLWIETILGPSGTVQIGPGLIKIRISQANVDQAVPESLVGHRPRCGNEQRVVIFSSRILDDVFMHDIRDRS